MKIGIDCRLWCESGVGRYTRNLIDQLQILDGKNDYILFVLSKDYEFIKSKIQNPKFKINKVDIRWHSIEEQTKFPSILSKENIDLVHFPYFSVPIFYKGPFVVTIHDLIIHHFSTGEASTLPLPIYKFKRLGYKFIVLNSIKRARKIITVSEATKKEIIEHFKVDPKKIAVTYEGVDENFRSKIKDQRSKLQLKTQSYFLYVGNAYPHKNLEKLLAAFETVVSKNPDISLVLVGKEDFFYKRLKEKVEKISFKDKVIFYGEANDSELITLYKNALALVFPSVMEGFGLPALEAMANECLVLASEIPSLKEVCGDIAIYFNPSDIKEIEDKLELVCSKNSNYFNKKREEGIKRVKLFSWEKMAKETLEVYEDCTSL